MAIGDPMTFTTPAVSTVGPTYATEVNAALDEIRARLEEKIPLSALQGGTFDLQNADINRVGKVIFTEQLSTPSTPEASIQYFGGDFYVVNGSGAIKVTDGSQLNFAAAGGIAGDYGGTAPASVRYDAANFRYEFYHNYSTVTWAYTRSAGVDIKGTGNFYALVRFAGAANITLTLPATKPGANRSLMQIDNAGLMTYNGTTDPCTNNIVLSGTTHVQHGTRTRNICLAYGNVDVKQGALDSTSTGIAVASGLCRFIRHFDLLPYEQIKNLSLTAFLAAGAGNFTMKLYKQQLDTGTGSITRTQIGSTSTVASGAGGIKTLTQAFTSTVDTAFSYHIEVELPNALDQCDNLILSWDVPA